jgi:hypothetical protein
VRRCALLYRASTQIRRLTYPGPREPSSAPPDGRTAGRERADLCFHTGTTPAEDTPIELGQADLPRNPEVSQFPPVWEANVELGPVAGDRDSDLSQFGPCAKELQGRNGRKQAAAAAPNAPTGSARRFGAFAYRAGEWTKHRLVVVKAEQTALGPNPRYVVVWGLKGKPRQLYQFYAGRGACENRIKELKEGVKSDRTSCCEFASNQVRLMLASVAYVLLQQLRRVARQTGLSRAQVEGLRLAVIKIAARVTERVRRVVIELCSSCPSQAVWRVLARRLGIVTG